MASNKIVINGNLEREVPDSFMGPLVAYLDMVKEKTKRSFGPDITAAADRKIFEANEPSEVEPVDTPDGYDLTSTEEVHEGGGPTIVKRTPDNSGQYLSDLPGWEVPVQNESFSQQLANESLHLVAKLMSVLEPVLTRDNAVSERARRSGSSLVETLQAVRLNLASLVRRIDI